MLLAIVAAVVVGMVLGYCVHSMLVVAAQHREEHGRQADLHNRATERSYQWIGLVHRAKDFER